MLLTQTQFRILCEHFEFHAASFSSFQQPVNLISSLRSTDNSVRALLCVALNNDKRATHSRFLLMNLHGRVRVRLTLMLAAAADATATPAPARLHWFTNTMVGVPFATPRTRRTSQVIEWLSRHPTIQVGG